MIMIRPILCLILSLLSAQLSIAADRAPASIDKIGMQFPVHTFSNLAKQKKKIPQQLDGDYKLMIVAFQRNHQQLVDTWFAAGDSLERSYNKPGKQFKYYEIPTIYKMGFLGRSFLNMGMRSGVKAQSARERTFTIYIDGEPVATNVECDRLTSSRQPINFGAFVGGEAGRRADLFMDDARVVRRR